MVKKILLSGAQIAPRARPASQPAFDISCNARIFFWFFAYYPTDRRSVGGGRSVGVRSVGILLCVQNKDRAQLSFFCGVNSCSKRFGWKKVPNVGDAEVATCKASSAIMASDSRGAPARPAIISLSLSWHDRRHAVMQLKSALSASARLRSSDPYELVYR